MNSPIAVLGAGSWGTALSIHLARRGREVRLWGHHRDHIRQLSQDRENRKYLPSYAFPNDLNPVENLEQAIDGCREILIVVPSHAFRAQLERLQPIWPEQGRLIWATKGFEPGTGTLLSDIAQSVLGDIPMAVISGPTFAAEVAGGYPAALTVASRDPDYAMAVATTLHDGRFRAYTSTDIIGVQVGGAVKNIMAIATGASDGLGFGANTRAALITRGLAEIMRFGLRLGGRQETFIGLAGVGDLVLTCTDDQSRNRRMGLALAEGLSIEAASQRIGQVVEGVKATQAVWHRARELTVDMPITEQLYRVLYEGLTPRSAVESLTSGEAKPEAS
ncbi:MAG: NAD(P)H-dependent glycerol-3-phosphate dehydrogenase [Pseudomonadota bacterium]|nr:NAD(P)H-dependent glycerol-3-phosphate dehydrogenase [Pseudomonadota bacterium]